MNRRPMVLASLILCSTALLLLAVAESIQAKSANTQPVALNLYQPLLGGGIGTDSVWSIVPSPNPGGDNILGAVAVDSAGGIWAVGSSGSWALIIHSTDGGVSWTTYTTTIGTFAGLYGVTALSPSNVFAVGYYRATNGAEVTLALLIPERGV